MNRNELRDYISDRLEIPELIAENPNERMKIEELLNIIVDALSTNKATIRCNGENKSAEVVKSQLMELTFEHMQYVLMCLKENTSSIKSIKSYLLTTLYNATMSMDNHYQAKVNHEFYN